MKKKNVRMAICVKLRERYKQSLPYYISRTFLKREIHLTREISLLTRILQI